MDNKSSANPGSESMHQESVVDNRSDLLETTPPIILGKGFSSLQRMIGQAIDRAGDVDIGANPTMYLYNQYIDPDLHPDEYTRPGGQKDLEFRRVLTACKGIVPVREAQKTQKDYKDYNTLHQMSPSEFMDVLGYEETVGHEDNLLDDLLLVDSDFLVDGKQLSSLEKEYIDQDQGPATRQGERPQSQTFIQVLKKVQKQCCHGKKKTCKHVHYLVGVGNYRLQDNVFSGIHIVRFPDFGSDQEERENKGPIHNPIDYTRFDYTHPSQKIIHYVGELRKTLSATK